MSRLYGDFHDIMKERITSTYGDIVWSAFEIIYKYYPGFISTDAFYVSATGKLISKLQEPKIVEIYNNGAVVLAIFCLPYRESEVSVAPMHFSKNGQPEQTIPLNLEKLEKCLIESKMTEVIET